ncbi:MAG: cyclic nucleotide-binding domain-containing protein, partial [Myxococcota bacterium]
MDAWRQLVDGVAELALGAAMETCHTLEVGVGEVIMEAGSLDPALTYVLAGQVEVRRGGVQLAVCGPGQILGEMGMFRDAPRMAEVVTVAPTRALVLTRAGYDALVEANNPVVYRLERQALEQLGQRLRRMDRLLSTRSEGEDDPFRKPPRGFVAQVRDLLLGEPVPELRQRGVDKVGLIEQSHLFRGERFALVQGLAELLEPEAFAAGEVICGQGEPGGPIHLVAEGTARVVVHVAPGRIHQLGTVGRGACVGMTALVDGRPRMASVVALEQVDTLALP